MNEIILHHYPESPVSEKVRVVLGIKGLAWRSVIIPRLPPKPDLMPLTGGYRQTPVMQIGADIFCDSQCIIRELERRFPEPTLYPGGGTGMVWGVSRWTDELLFRHAITVVLGSKIHDLPDAFLKDRMRVYYPADTSAEALEKSVPHALAQLRAQIGWMEQRLETGRRFMLGDAPGLPDALCYYLVWFLRGRYERGDEFLAQFPALCSWEARVREIGHGSRAELGSGEALRIAGDAEPATLRQEDAADPEGLAPGQSVAVCGEPCVAPVKGEIVSVSSDALAIRRYDDAAGRVVVHFPRVGYTVRKSS